jgi:hypothetical protein
MRTIFWLLSLFCLFYVTTAKNYITETKTYKPECALELSDFEDSAVQYKSSLGWAKGRPINKWRMQPWTVIADPKNDKLVSRSILLLNGESVKYTSIQYETEVSLNPIFSKIINTELPITIHKELFLMKNRLKIFVKIENVPIISHLYITNIIDITKKDAVVSSHFISHGPIPWYAKWTIRYLKAEIIESIDGFDILFFKNCCSRS